MEDTVWPFQGSLENYVAASGKHYAREMRDRADEGNADPARRGGVPHRVGSGRRREIVLWQRGVKPRGVVPLLTREVPEKYRAPGTWMHDALQLRDQWKSRLLRSLPWSPLADLPPVADRGWPRTLPAVQTAPVTLEPATRSDAPLLANLLELYVHDLSEIFPVRIGEDGRFGYERLPLYGRSRSGASRS